MALSCMDFFPLLHARSRNGGKAWIFICADSWDDA